MSDIIIKSEKIASAVYFITSFFVDDEPLKWEMRQIASSFAVLKESTLGEVKQSALDLRNLLRVAKNAGLISASNHDLMDREISRYIGELNTSFDVSPMLPASTPTIKDRIAEPTQSIQIERMEPREDLNVLKDFGVVSAKKNTRRSIIIGLLKRKKEVMIKDITPLITGCSEKTIQRELLSMVKSGVIRKEGEKRWSRYSLGNLTA